MNCKNGSLAIALLKNRVLTSRSKMKKYLSHDLPRVAYCQSNLPETTSVQNMYNDGSFLSEYLDFHYSPQNYFNISNFAETCARLSVEACREYNIRLDSALDAGCSVGRYSFELAKLGFQDVLGVDNSERFLRIAQKLKKRGSFKYSRTKEGEIVELKEIDFEKMGLVESRDRVKFTRGDMNSYCEISNKEETFDLVFAGNVICRMHDPRRFLGNVHSVMKPEALLIITSTYSWMKAFTPRDRWVGGYLKDGKEFLGYQGLQEVLRENFIEIKKPKNIDFIIRQNEREFIHSIAEMTFWKKVK